MNIIKCLIGWNEELKEIIALLVHTIVHLLNEFNINAAVTIIVVNLFDLHVYLLGLIIQLVTNIS